MNNSRISSKNKWKIIENFEFSNPDYSVNKTGCRRLSADKFLILSNNFNILLLTDFGNKINMFSYIKILIHSAIYLIKTMVFKLYEKGFRL